MQIQSNVYLEGLRYRLCRLNYSGLDGVFVGLVLRYHVGVHIGIYCHNGAGEIEYWY